MGEEYCVGLAEAFAMRVQLNRGQEYSSFGKISRWDERSSMNKCPSMIATI